MDNKTTEEQPISQPLINDSLYQPDYEEESREGSLSSLISNLNAIAMQLDNSPLLRRSKCRFMAGYFGKKGNFRQWVEDNINDVRKPKMNDKGWLVCEQFIDKNTCPNEVLGNKVKSEIRRGGLVESITLLIDICKHYKEYGINPIDIPFIGVNLGAICLSGQNRSINGQTAKAINKVIKQVENIFKGNEQNTEKGVLNKIGRFIKR